MNKNEGRAGRGQAETRWDIRVPHLETVWQGRERALLDGEPDKRANERARR